MVIPSTCIFPTSHQKKDATMDSREKTEMKIELNMLQDKKNFIRLRILIGSG